MVSKLINFQTGLLTTAPSVFCLVSPVTSLIKVLNKHGKTGL